MIYQLTITSKVKVNKDQCEVRTDTSSLPFNIGTNASYTTYMIVFIQYDVFVADGWSSKHSITFVIVNSYMYCAIGCNFYAHRTFLSNKVNGNCKNLLYGSLYSGGKMKFIISVSKPTHWSPSKYNCFNINL